MSWAVVLSLVLALLTTAAAALFAGLWWGERGRRLDAQKWADGRKVTPPVPARIQGEKPPPGAPDQDPAPARPSGEERVSSSGPLIDEELRERTVAGIARDFGVPDEVAEKAAEEAWSKVLGDAGIS